MQYSLTCFQVILRETQGVYATVLIPFASVPFKADATEHKRLDLQHDMLTARMGGLFLCPDVVERALKPRGNSQPAVLDVGTGSGSWAIGVAQMFPHANVVGLDLAPVNPISQAPPNCQFECGDVNEDLSRFYNSFDVIHARAIIQGIRDYRVFLREVVKMLRPGGVFISLEAQFELFDAARNPFGVQVPGDPLDAQATHFGGASDDSEPHEVVDLWIRNTQTELTEAKVKQYGRWPGVWAIKKSINHDTDPPTYPDLQTMEATNKEQSPALKKLYGRMVNNTSEVTVLADLIEHSRLDMQHEAICIVLDGPVPRESGVHEILSPRTDGRQPRVLDVGTGAGSWAIAIAKAYPHVEVIGLDLAPVNTGSSPPDNCCFEKGDAHTDLGRFGRFDVVHARAVLQGIKDFAAFFKEVADILNPGGMFLTIEPEMGLFDERKEAVGIQDEGDPHYLWSQKLFKAYVDATVKRNPGFAELPNARSILDNVPGRPWESVEGNTFYLPVGPFLPDPPLRVAGELMRQACMRMPKGIQPLLLLHGYNQEDLDRWAALAEAQMKDMAIKFYMKWDSFWAIKRRNE
ncbi:hypothetical protein FS837_000214 [Tulasnella sp. UAMH 9824]|nr:hypothetical protein FS837_000214 [Tulasnella sp. UAMH 9824]